MKYQARPHYLYNPAFTTPEIAQVEESFLTNWLSIHEPPDEQRLFHYTTLDGMQGILNSRSLWLGHVTSLSDRSEIQYGQQLIEEVFKEITKQESNDILRQFIQQLGVWIHAFAAHSMHHIFVACFCESRDLLSQWRGYAQRGEGYCLGFEFSSVTRIASNLDNLNNAKEPYLRKVIYLPTKQKELVSSYLSSLLPAVQAALSSSRLPKQDSMTNVTIMAIQSASILLDMLFSFKHPAFVSEQEWRLVWVTRNDFEPQGVNFRERLGQLIPYRPVYIFDNLAESSRSFPLRSIGFGPLLEPLRTRATLQLLLQRMSKAVHPISIQPSFEIFEAGFSLRPG